MHKRVQITVAAFIVVLIGVITWQILCEREPVYQGKTLSVWLGECRPDWVGPETEAAVRAIGADALPTLLNMVQVGESVLKNLFTELSNRQGWLGIHFRSTEDIQLMAYCGFMVLGPTAKSAVPKLAPLLNDDDRQGRFVAALCLGNLGPHRSGCCACLGRLPEPGIQSEHGEPVERA